MISYIYKHVENTLLESYVSKINTTGDILSKLKSNKIILETYNLYNEFLELNSEDESFIKDMLNEFSKSLPINYIRETHIKKFIKDNNIKKDKSDDVLVNLLDKFVYESDNKLFVKKNNTVEDIVKYKLTTYKKDTSVLKERFNSIVESIESELEYDEVELFEAIHGSDVTKKQGSFLKLKMEALDNINKLFESESDIEVKNRLLNLKNKTIEMTYKGDSINEDLIKLYEITKL